MIRKEKFHNVEKQLIWLFIVEAYSDVRASETPPFSLENPSFSTEKSEKVR